MPLPKHDPNYYRAGRETGYAVPTPGIPQILMAINANLTRIGDVLENLAKEMTDG